MCIMDPSNISTKKEVAHDVFPYLVEYKDGSVERLAGISQAPAGFDPTTGVTSKDVVLVSDTGLSARLYRPSSTTTHEKLPVVLYFHGGAFLIASPAEPLYNNFCNSLAGSAKALVVSVDYRRAPEYPLPIAFDDSWAAIQWVAAHTSGDGPESWLNNEEIDFKKVFLVGDSAGATMAHHLAPEVVTYLSPFKVHGIALIHPYFWGSEPIGLERVDPVRRELVDKWWEYVCPSDKGSDDPLINPFVDGAPRFDEVVSEKMVVLVAEKDILRERGRLYYETMLKVRKVEYFESQGEDHVFYIFNPQSENAKALLSKLASFINNQIADNSSV